MTNNDESSSYRLPIVLKPKHYDLSYHHIDMNDSYRFAGKVTLHGIAAKTQELEKIIVHTYEIQVYDVKLIVFDEDKDTDEKKVKTTVNAIEYIYHVNEQTCEIVFTNSHATDDNGIIMLQGNKEYHLVMNFMGTLNNQMRGFYRSTYVDLFDCITKKTIATTQFEPTDARRAFPCIDEPAWKATFQVTLTIPTTLQCISNTPIESIHTIMNDSNNQKMKIIKFQTTPKMSTYLLAYIIGEFDGQSQTSSLTNVVTTVYTVPGKAHEASFCLDVAVKCLDYYQTKLFHGIPFPLPKSDLIAIPDFSAGAMENWGCVTYREAKVLVQPGKTSETIKRGIARTVCHELAHQWFGNLVTMEWWTCLYLNEGFARFMEFVAIDTIFPQWDIWTEFVQSVYNLAMNLDAMNTSHPVEVNVNHPNEIEHIFDAISYAKGASILRMIASHIGMEVFFQGIRNYLIKHAYGNTVTNDLWKSLEDVSGQPVIQFMANWTKCVGYPILSITPEGKIATERFYASGRQQESETTVWPIPITAKVQGIEEIQGPWILNGPLGVDDTSALEQKIKEWKSQSKWFKLNANQTAFIRVNYNPEQWLILGSNVMNPTSLASNAKSSELSISDRIGLVSDCFAAGKAGYSNITDALALIEAFGEHEIADYAVWQEISENLSTLVALYRSESFFTKFQSFIKQIYSRQYELLGWEVKANELGRTGTLRATVISMMGKTKDPHIGAKAYELFMANKNDATNSPVTGDLRCVIYRCALRHDEVSVYQSLKEIYESTSFPEEQRDCLSIMGCVQDPKLHRDMLDYTFCSGKVRSQDIATPLSTLASASIPGGRATWEYFQQHYDTLRSRYINGPLWAICVGLCCSGMSGSLSEADEVEEYFQSPGREPGPAEKRLSQTLEVLRTKVARRERDRAIVDAYFRDR